ncbi:hypothetical protein, partial [Salmonella sp. s51933]|uniref:hypothetical protein n=1 Tax=Salmonella sp. s51933 TaxID=3160127 RepID=UPI003754AF7C
KPGIYLRPAKIFIFPYHDLPEIVLKCHDQHDASPHGWQERVSWNIFNRSFAFVRCLLSRHLKIHDST